MVCAALEQAPEHSGGWLGSAPRGAALGPLGCGVLAATDRSMVRAAVRVTRRPRAGFLWPGPGHGVFETRSVRRRILRRLSRSSRAGEPVPDAGSLIPASAR